MELLIKIEQLNKFYGSNHVLKNINLDIHEGDKIGIVGPNGNGKTTLCEIITGLRPYSSGSLMAQKSLIYGMQLQENPFPAKITTWDFCKFYIHSYKLVIPKKVLLEKIRLLTLEGLLQTPVDKLSGGQKQRVNILLSTIHQPDFLVLDELVSGLDIESRDMIYKYMDINLQDIKSLILISHDLDTIERFCNKLLVLINGEIVSFVDIISLKQKYGSINEYVRSHFKDYYAEKDRNFNIKNKSNNSSGPSYLRELEKSNQINQKYNNHEK